MMGYQTPNIDRIAREGVAFTDYYGQQSCTAGRAAFLGGNVPVRTGMTKVGLPGAKEGWQKTDVTIATVTPTRTVSFVVAPAQLGSIPGGTIPSVPFTVHYRVADGTTQQTMQEFSGAGTGYSVWTYQVKPGDQLTLEASAPGADTMITINVLAGAAGGPDPSVELGMARSFLPGAAAKLNVFCCATPAP